MGADTSSRQRSTDGAARSCVGCGASAPSSRCDECGAAISPGGYRLERLISRTAHSRVYLAEDPQGRRVALKELLFSQVPDVQALDAFEREARLLQQLDHPAIPKLLQSFREGTGAHLRLYLAQQFVAGETLLTELERAPLDEEGARQVALEVLEVLTFLHSRAPPILHRDIKPQNLIRRPDGTIAVVDFGSAREVARGATFGSTLVGTFGYMPLEQLGGTVSASSDLYALGASLVHLLTARSPAELFQPPHGLELGRVLSGSPLLGWLERLVAAKPEDRFSSAEEAKSALLRPSRPTRPAPARLKTRAPIPTRPPRVSPFQGAPHKPLALLAVLLVTPVLISAHRAWKHAHPAPAVTQAAPFQSHRVELNHGWQQGPLHLVARSAVRETSYLEPGKEWVNVTINVENRSPEKVPLEALKRCRLVTRAGQVLTPSTRSTAQRTVGPHGRATLGVVFFVPPADLVDARLQLEDGALLSLVF